MDFIFKLYFQATGPFFLQKVARIILKFSKDRPMPVFLRSTGPFFP